LIAGFGYHPLDAPVNPDRPRATEDGINSAMNTPVEPPETIEVEQATIACDGGGALGHPKVYLSLAEKGRVECPYCDRLFVLKKAAP
jgi:uncharacterized Zn-finger protein